MSNAGRFKLVLGLAVLVLVATSVGYLVINPGRGPAPPPIKPVDVEQAEVVIDGFNFARSEGADSDWRLTAKQAVVSKQSGMATLTGLTAIIGTGTGREVTLTAESGSFDTNTNAVELSGGDGVKLSTDDGYVMRFEDLRWDDSSKELTTDKSVRIDGRNIEMVGKGMVARADLQEVRITDGVRTVFKPGR